ncbi:I78 family peptidase inhibitor [Streptomyces sp. NPDC087440]|uniref:I78 family peptidase inhibitor n=1 Tax=Streptomyces sp. NPDC087440 TaxID=3365790 RepID=UPI00380D9CCE
MHSSHLKTLFTAAALAATFFAPAAESHAAEAEHQPAVAVAPDYDQWIGRTLVRDGDTDPVGLPADRIVHERDIPKPYRIVRPGAMLTQEYMPDRLNVHVDDANRITRITFG